MFTWCNFHSIFFFKLQTRSFCTSCSNSLGTLYGKGCKDKKRLSD
jgi:hypothetical protein